MRLIPWTHSRGSETETFGNPYESSNAVCTRRPVGRKINYYIVKH